MLTKGSFRSDVHIKRLISAEHRHTETTSLKKKKEEKRKTSFIPLFGPITNPSAFQDLAHSVYSLELQLTLVNTLLIYLGPSRLPPSEAKKYFIADDLF